MSCLGSAVDLSLASVNVEVRLEDYLNANTGLVSLNVLFVSRSLVVLYKFANFHVFGLSLGNRLLQEG